MNSNWGPAALIVLGYIVAAYWNSKRFDDFKLWMGAELKRIEDTLGSELKRLEEKIDNSVKRLEDKIEAARSPVNR